MDSRFTPFILIRTSRRYLRRLHVILGNLFVVCAVLVALGVASAAADMPSTPQAITTGNTSGQGRPDGSGARHAGVTDRACANGLFHP